MHYLLDTDICIYLINHSSPKLRKKFSTISNGDIAISTVTLSELQYGVEKSLKQNQNQKSLEKFLLLLEVLPYPLQATRPYGHIRARLEKKGQLIGSMDLMIAAHAMAEDLTLVTNNVREFKRIPGLRVENWIAGM